MLYINVPIYKSKNIFDILDKQFLIYEGCATFFLGFQTRIKVKVVEGWNVQNFSICFFS